MDIKSLIEQTLNVPCFIDGSAIVYPSVVLDMVSSEATLVGDGRTTRRTKTVTAILYYTTKSDRDAAADTLAMALDSAKEVTPPDIIYDYDEVSKKWRATFSVEFI